MRETQLGETRFPESCPYTLEQTLNPEVSPPDSTFIRSTVD
ncbi:hypothetical protein [Leptolyngbya sp. 7M]